MCNWLLRGFLRDSNTVSVMQACICYFEHGHVYCLFIGIVCWLLSCMLQLVTERRIPECPYCHRVFHNASSDLRRHIWIHEGIKPFECHVCQYACRTRSNLAAHMLRHSADKPFLCNSCGKAYKSRTALRWHERSHVNGRMFKCDKYVLIVNALAVYFLNQTSN